MHWELTEIMVRKNYSLFFTWISSIVHKNLSNFQHGGLYSQDLDEGIFSQNVDSGLGFHIMKCRNSHFKEGKVKKK